MIPEQFCSGIICNLGKLCYTNENAGETDAKASSGDTAQGNEQELNYMSDMLYLDGAASSTDPSVQMAYQYITNPENEEKQIPQEVMEAYEDFMKDISKKSGDYQIQRSHEIAMGDADINDYDVDNLKERNETFSNPTDIYPNITNEFGEYSKKYGYHVGIDIGNADLQNLNVKSIFFGEIVFSGWAGKNGFMVIIQHTKNINGKEITFYSSYSHLNADTEKIATIGMKVYPGEQIGIMGETGNSDGIHLHLDIFTTTMDISTVGPRGYTDNEIDGYTWTSASGRTIYYDPEKVLETNGAILE